MGLSISPFTSTTPVSPSGTVLVVPSLTSGPAAEAVVGVSAPAAVVGVPEAEVVVAEPSQAQTKTASPAKSSTAASTR